MMPTTPVFPMPVVNFITELAEALGHDSRGAVLGESELGMHVQVATNEHDVVRQGLRDGDRCGHEKDVLRRLSEIRLYACGVALP